MDALFALHLLIFGIILSIPLWPIPYLKYGIYVPILIAILWVVFNGCPLTKYQTNLNTPSFTREIYAYIIPNITVATAERINTAALVFITMLGFRRLKCSNM